jgi:hypothetical protein
MIPLIMFLIYATASPAPQQSPHAQRPRTIERLCGKLVKSDYLAARGNGHASERKTHPLRKVILQLYPRQSNSECCDGLLVVAQAKTGRWGDFKIKHAMAGDYWLVARVEAREYKVPILYHPTKGGGPLCSSFTWEVWDTGEFGLSETVTVD